LEPRNEIQREISRRIDSFVNEITELARQHALDTLAAALETRGGLTGARAGAGSTGRRRGGKRSSGEIQREAARLFSFIQGNPGQRMEEIGKGIGTSTKELTLPIKKLLSDGRVTSEGQKRATRYFASENGAAAPRKRRGRPRKKS
jgi:hypothetical protein